MKFVKIINTTSCARPVPNNGLVKPDDVAEISYFDYVGGYKDDPNWELVNEQVNDEYREEVIEDFSNVENFEDPENLNDSEDFEELELKEQ